MIWSIGWGVMRAQVIKMKIERDVIIILIEIVKTSLIIRPLHYRWSLLSPGMVSTNLLKYFLRISKFYFLLYFYELLVNFQYNSDMLLINIL